MSLKRNFLIYQGKKSIEYNSINFQTDQYSMLNLFDDKIQKFDDSKNYPADKKYGLACFREHEWIFFTKEELYYQQYLSDSNRKMNILYNDYSKNILYQEFLFTEDGKYFLRSYRNSKIFEKNAFNFFQEKTQLKQAPDLLIKLKDNRAYTQHKELYPFLD